MRNFTFKSSKSYDFFEITNIIKRSFLPPIAVPTIKIPNKAGLLPMSRNEVGALEFEITVTMLADSSKDLRERVRELGAFLIHEKSEWLIFSDEPQLFYNARFTGTANDLEELAYTGEGTIHFTAFDPFAYSLLEYNQLISGIESSFINNGSFETFPRIRIVPDANCDFITIQNLTTGKKIKYDDFWYAYKVLIIDTATNEVYEEYKQDVSLVKNITLDSDFFSLKPGVNTISIINQNATLGTGVSSKMRLYWRARYW